MTFFDRWVDLNVSTVGQLSPLRTIVSGFDVVELMRRLPDLDTRGAEFRELAAWRWCWDAEFAARAKTVLAGVPNSDSRSASELRLIIHTVQALEALDARA